MSAGRSSKKYYKRQSRKRIMRLKSGISDCSPKSEGMHLDERKGSSAGNVASTKY